MPAIQRIFRRVPFTRDRFKAAAHFDCPKWPPANLPRVVYHPTKGNTHQQIVTLMDLLDKVPCMHGKQSSSRFIPKLVTNHPWQNIDLKIADLYLLFSLLHTFGFKFDNWNCIKYSVYIMVLFGIMIPSLPQHGWLV